MSASITLQKESDTLGLHPFNSQKKSKLLNGSPNNPLQLLPRAVACKGNASTKQKSFIRSIQFDEVGELGLFQIDGAILKLHSESHFATSNNTDVDKNQPANGSNVTPFTVNSKALSNGLVTPKSLAISTSLENNTSSGIVIPNSSIKSNSLENVISTFSKASDDSAIIVKTNSLPNSHLGRPEDQRLLKSFFNTSQNDEKPSTSQFNGNSRKRNLSDRGEQESQFPRVDRSSLYNTWEGCRVLNGSLCGSGLINPLNNCFLNSVLQAVVHIPHLARMILDLKDLRMCRKSQAKANCFDCFHCGLKNHIIRAIKSDHPLNTNWIQPFLRKIFPHHRNGVQEDAHEMLTLLLGALEITPPKPTMNGLKVHGPSLSTPIEQIFGGNLRNLVICNVCKTEHINYERIREMNLGLTRTCNADIETLIDDFFKDEQLQNFFCSKCKKKQTATRRTFLLSAPYVLIIQLKRFNAYGGKNRTPVRPNKSINLSKHSFRQEQSNYQLHGLIQHIGGGINFGHYICAMRGFNNRDMFLFDDSERRQVGIKYVMEKMEPYILFYTRHQMPNNQFKPIPRRSFEGCRPNYAKQARIENYNNKSTNSFIGSSKMLNQTFGAYI